MKYIIVLGGLIFLLLTNIAAAGTYQCTIPTAGEAVLDEAIATDFPGLTRTQVIQRMCNREIRALFAQQTARESSVLDNMLLVATNAAKNNARTALNAGITAPVVTDVSNQTHNVGNSPVIPLASTHPYPEDLAVTFGVTGLPPGMALTSHATTGAPQITGTLATAGTYSVTIEAWNGNITSKKGTDTFSWQVNP